MKIFTACVSPSCQIGIEIKNVISMVNSEGYTLKRYYRVGEVAEYFAVSERTVYRMINAGEIRIIRFRERIRIPAEEVRALEERLFVDEI